MTRTPWQLMAPEDRVKAVQLAWRDGTSASGIAEKLCDRFKARISRNAVVGYYNRYPVELQAYPLRPAQGKYPPLMPESENCAIRRAKKAKPMRFRPRERVEAVSRVSAPLEPPTPEFLSLSQMRPISRVTRNKCRWAVSADDVHPSDHRFCGCETSLGRSYCDYHQAKSAGEGSRFENIGFKLAVKESA